MFYFFVEKICANLIHSSIRDAALGDVWELHNTMLLKQRNIYVYWNSTKTLISLIIYSNELRFKSLLKWCSSLKNDIVFYISPRNRSNLTNFYIEIFEKYSENNYSKQSTRFLTVLAVLVIFLTVLSYRYIGYIVSFITQRNHPQDSPTPSHIATPHPIKTPDVIDIPGPLTDVIIIPDGDIHIIIATAILFSTLIFYMRTRKNNDK